MELEANPRKQIEATISYGPEDMFAFHVRPAECVDISFEPPIDALSLHLQRFAQARLGITLPDLRFRVVTNPTTDGIAGFYFGTLRGAVRKAWRTKLAYESQVSDYETELLSRIAFGIPPSSKVVEGKVTRR